MASLKKLGYVKSTKGQQGGWELAVPLKSITLYDIYSAFDNGHLFNIGLADKHSTCLIEREISAKLGETLQVAEQYVLNEFKKVTLDDLAANSRSAFKEFQDVFLKSPT